VFSFPALLYCQGRNINKLTLETTYSYSEIHKSLRDLVDNVKKEDFFKDEFFNNMLMKILQDKQFTYKEKVQLFYLMQKKLGYAFVGINYLPPKQNYFIFHLSKIQVLERTKNDLKALKLDPSMYILMADSHKTNDPIIASNALLIAALINTDKTLIKLRQASETQNIIKSKNPVIYNHYLCLSSALVQDSIVTRNLKKNIFEFKEEGMIEDAICAFYSKPNPVGPIKEILIKEKNPNNDLVILTAICALHTKISENSFQQAVKNLSNFMSEKWKVDLLTKVADGAIPFNYPLTKADQLAAKVWDFVQVTYYNDGALISNNTLLEFDPN
jgi:hypothetical protein